MNIQALMQQAQAMQKQVEQNVESAKKTLAQKEVQGQEGNGPVKETITLPLMMRYAKQMSYTKRLWQVQPRAWVCPRACKDCLVDAHPKI